MFVELLDHLRCTATHEESWLVVHAEEARDRHVIRGILACPICGRRYALQGGRVHFADGAPSPGAVAPDAHATAGEEWPLRLAAFLGLGEGGGAVGLYGAWAEHAEALGDVVERVEPLAIAPAGATHPMLSAIVPPALERVPLATGSLRAVALHDLRGRGDAAVAAIVGEAARLVRSGGRLLAPAMVPVPHGVRELARDDAWWVGERDAAPAGIVSIAGRRR